MLSTRQGSGVEIDAFHEKAVNYKLRFTSTFLSFTGFEDKCLFNSP